MTDEVQSALMRIEGTKAIGVGQHLINVMKAVLASAPFCGGLASLMSDYIPNRRLERLERFAETVAADLSRVHERAEPERLQTDEYAFIFERCFRGASEFPQPEKLRAFRGILVNAVLPSDLGQDEQEFFLTLAERLSPLHLRMIRFMADPRGYLAAMGIPEERIGGGFSTFFPIALPGVKPEVIEAAFADLHTLGLTNTSPSIFHTMTAGRGLALLGDRLTPLAKRFKLFCTSPVEEEGEDANAPST